MYKRFIQFQYQALAYAPNFAAPENITLDKWFRPLSDPRKLAKDRVVEFPAFAYGARPIVVDVDIWWQNLATPPKAKPRTIEFPAFTYGPVPIVNTPDQWWQNLATPPKAALRTIEYPAFTYGPVPIVSTPDRWWRDLDTPPKAALRTAEYPFLAFVAPQPGAFERWWFSPLAEPRRRQFGQDVWEQRADFYLRPIIRPFSRGYVIC